MSTQTELLPEDVCAAHHHDNPESRAAFDSILPNLSNLQERVLGHALFLTDRGEGVTVKRVRYDLNLQHQTASARLTELKKAELIAPTNRRHEGCRVLEITDLGRRTLAAWTKETRG